MAVQCPQCGEWAYADGVCAQCGFSLAAAPWEGTQEVSADQGSASDPHPQYLPWAQVSVDAIGQSSREEAAPPRQLRIRKLPQDSATSDEGQTWEFSVDGKQINIGRAPSCDLTLESDLLVSRRHAIIFPRDGRHLLFDLGSSNGTWVNETLITQEMPLSLGDTIRIGEYELVYDAVTTVAKPQTAASLSETDMLMPSSLDAEYPYAADVSTAPNQANPLPAERAHEDAQPASLIGSASPSQSFLTPLLSPAPADHNLDSLQSQVVGLVTALRQQAEEDARYADHVRGALSDVQRALGELLTRYGSPPVEGAALDDLVAVVRQAAENPRHLDYVIDLAMHAESLAHAFDAVRALYAPQGLLDSLARLKEHLDQLLG